MPMHRSLWFCAAIVLLWACAAPVPPTQSPSVLPTTTHPPSRPVPRFEIGPCKSGSQVNPNIQCGDLIVPEDRSQPFDPAISRTIQVHVVIIKSQTPDPEPDPVVFLNGGPGSSTTVAAQAIKGRFEPVIGKRDLILVDQRGAGFSEPSLDCPGLTRFFTINLGQEWTTRQAQLLAECRERLERDQINLKTYNSVESVADLNELRTVLGYDSWNLYAVSYGTRVALTYFREHPEGIRSAILDSAAPPQANLLSDYGSNTQAAFDLLFARCAADETCNRAYPDLKALFFELVDRFNQQPIHYRLYDPYNDNQALEVEATGQSIVLALFEQLFKHERIQYGPQVLYQLKAGDHGELREILQGFITQSKFDSEGLVFSTVCYEELPFNPPETIRGANSRLDLQISHFFDTLIASYPEACAIWGVDEAGLVENKQVSSEIPTLILAGEFDPSTPPAWGKLAAEGLSRSYFYEFPWTGHGVFFSPDPIQHCVQAITRSFLERPENRPEDTCLAELPEVAFFTP